MDNALSFSDLSYQISGADILKSLDLDVPAQSYFAIAGVNGAGKSTLIKLALDLIRPSKNSEITIFGQSNRDIRCRNRLVYLPEKFDVKKSVSGWQYLEFIAATYHLSLDKKAVGILAERFDFSPDRLDSRVGSYSKGMVQKLGLISCFMLERELLILDEPLSGLDPSARYHFKQYLRDEKSKGTTIFYSTHMLADAEDLCDYFAILNRGEIKYSGTPTDCMRQYGNESLEKAYMGCISEA
ncbi:MAG: ABC-2 type transport system ATP-binding protein [Planctomycetota bacterium]|jgi:ABC-2 type transport system ATP-binding protein